MFKIDPVSGAETLLYSFTGGADGGNPYTVPGLLNVGGALYGTTSDQSLGSGGTVFKIDPVSGAESVVYSFTGGADGGYPIGGLLNVGGVLYGTTYQGGASNTGTVYKLTP